MSKTEQMDVLIAVYLFEDLGSKDYDTVMDLVEQKSIAVQGVVLATKDEHGDMKQFVRQWKAVGDRIKLMCGVGEILAPSYFARVQAVNRTNTA